MPEANRRGSGIRRPFPTNQKWHEGSGISTNPNWDWRCPALFVRVESSLVRSNLTSWKVDEVSSFSLLLK